MTQYVLILFSALLLTILATPVVRTIARRLEILDQPSARKAHQVPTPLLGGVAIYLAVIAALAAWGDRFYVNQVAGILLGATLVSFMGLWDDRKPLSPWVKLAGQFLAAAIVLVSGLRISALPWDWANTLVTLLWMVAITNALNLLDNMDGLSSGVATIAAVFFLLFAAMSKQYLVGVLAAALVGACAGFLIFNFNPATIFMGDSGSLFLGFVLAAVGIKLRFPDNSPFVTWMVPVLVLGLPIFDTTLVVISRLRRRLNPLTTPGRDHLSHRLASLTGSRREAVLICYLAAGCLGVSATFVTQANIAEGYAAGGLVALAGAYALYRLETLPAARGGRPNHPVTGGAPGFPVPGRAAEAEPDSRSAGPGRPRG